MLQNTQPVRMIHDSIELAMIERTSKSDLELVIKRGPGKYAPNGIAMIISTVHTGRRGRCTMKNILVAVVLATALSVACNSEEDNTDTGSDVAGEVVNDNYPCTREVEAVLTFWDVTCWSAQIVCDGKQVAVNDQEEGTTMAICDIGPGSCEEPGVHTYNYTFEYTGGECEYCSHSEDIDICVPLDSTCEEQVVEITASGSEEGGVHPMVCCPDDPDCM